VIDLPINRDLLATERFDGGVIYLRPPPCSRCGSARTEIRLRVLGGPDGKVR
jgi:hypothetical protein